MKELKDLCRANIWNLAPYSCARTEFSGKSASVFLDANENPYNEPFNRYPDPFQTEVKVALSKIKNVPVENIFLGNGSDEAIDLVYRVFCNPGIDNVVAIAPTYGMCMRCVLMSMMSNIAPCYSMSNSKLRQRNCWQHVMTRPR